MKVNEAQNSSGDAELLPMPTCVDAVAWAEEADRIAVVLREMADKFDGIDNGHCTVCRIGFRYWVRLDGKTKGKCDNERCLSHRIAATLARYDSLSPEHAEQIKQRCLAKLNAPERETETQKVG